MDHIKLGKIGEATALKFLLAKQYTLCTKNWRYGKYEIDLIMMDKNSLVFIEVKTRRNCNYGYPEEQISSAQIDRISIAAEHYIHTNLAKTRLNLDVRIDFVSVIISPNKKKIKHISDAVSFYS